MPVAFFSQVTIIMWPQSQRCMNCKNGEFVESETFDSSNYICWKDCTENKGSVCPMFEEDTDVDNDMFEDDED